jgi:transmembrane sensor
MSEDIHILLGKYFSGQISEEESRTVRQWIQEKDTNAAEFNLLRKLWEGESPKESYSFNTDLAWKKVDSQISKTSDKKSTPVKFMRVVVGIAAMLILISGIWILMDKGPAEQHIVAEGAVKEIVLPDGSRVYLRKGGKLDYPEKFSNEVREVSLTGEAFFEVMPDPSKPFIISAAATQVQVLGTSFSVNTNSNRVELIVKTGRVQFSAKKDKNKKLLVVAGERAVFVNDELSKQSNTDANFNAWQSRQLVFSNEPVENLAKTIAGYYGVSITIKKEDWKAIAGEGVTASFKNQDLESVLKELTLITGYRIRQTGQGQYEISLK